VADRGWGRPFEESIEVDGRKLVTLRDAGEYIAALPKKEHDQLEWLAAMEALLLVVKHGGPTMFARIGIMRALNRHRVPELNPKGKKPYWGRRKLKRTNDRGRKLSRRTLRLEHAARLKMFAGGILLVALRGWQERLAATALAHLLL
jgi:hypothetical protein